MLLVSGWWQPPLKFDASKMPADLPQGKSGEPVLHCRRPQEGKFPARNLPYGLPQDK
jgi:hypothetical protein